MTVQIIRRQFTVADYYRMLESGILDEDDRVELIDGEIREMTPIDAVHTASVKRLNDLLMSRLQGRFIIGVQDPVWLDEIMNQSLTYRCYAGMMITMSSIIQCRVISYF